MVGHTLRSWLTILALGAALLAALPALAQNSGERVEVSVDRTELARGETLTLTVRVFQQMQNIQLDLSSITGQFDILATRTSSQIRSINNNVESWVDYIITLFPTQEGELEIPALSIAGMQTDSITITVVDAGPNSSQGNNDLFLETEINKESVYVQEQVLFTIRLYYTISGIRNPQFTELEMPDTVIQLIGSPNQYEKLVDGVRYGVYEKRYVIFPQRSGTLEIPDILFRGEVTDGSSNFVFRNLNTQRVTAYIEGAAIEVKERPESARALGAWLPATSVSLGESWSDDLSNLKVGDSITRTVTLVAEGLDGAVLPPFSPTTIDGLNLYADPSDIQRTFVDGSIVGTRVERISVVPTRAGIIEVPEISIPWWDTETDTLQYAQLPATLLDVAAVGGAAPSEQAVESTGPVTFFDGEDAPALTLADLQAQSQANTINVPLLWLYLLSIAAVAAVLGSIYWLVVRQFDIDPMAHVRAWMAERRERMTPARNEAIAYRNAVTALNGTDLRKIRETLIVWAAHYYAPERILSMDDLIRRNPDSDFGRQCLNLQAALFNTQQPPAVDTARLAAALQAMRTHRRTAAKAERKQAPYRLPPLYKV